MHAHTIKISEKYKTKFRDMKDESHVKLLKSQKQKIYSSNIR